MDDIKARIRYKVARRTKPAVSIRKASAEVAHEPMVGAMGDEAESDAPPEAASDQETPGSKGTEGSQGRGQKRGSDEEPDAAADGGRFRDARQRTTEGTVLLFDKERIFWRTDEGLTNPSPFNKGQRVQRYTLAFINSRVKTEAEAEVDPWFTYNYPGLEGILVPLKDEVREIMRAHVVSKLALAMDAGADAVVFPEFAFPPVDVGNQFSKQQDFNPFDPLHQEEIDRRFEQSASEMLMEACQSIGRDPATAPFIFYGSMHCRWSRYNIGVVSPGYPFENSYVLAAERENPITRAVKSEPETEARSGPLIHKKRFPARRVGEAARVPGGLGFRLYPSRIGSIAVMICSDAIDLNQFYYIVGHNQQADTMTHFDRIGLVIVPAYTHSDLLHTTCKDLSEMAHTTVFVGNAIGKLPTRNPLHTTAMPSSAIFQCGFEQTELDLTDIVATRTKLGVRYYEFDPAPPGLARPLRRRGGQA